MSLFLQLLPYAAIPVALAIGFYFLDKYTKFHKIPYIWQQIIIGVAFGLAAVLANEKGVLITIDTIVIEGKNYNSATANVRDASPLLAGLLFGGPAGIIAGVIGGVERFFAAYWGKGMLTQWACSVSTILAGVCAAALRKFFFKGERPRWGFAIAIAVVMEVFHFVMVFIIGIKYPTQMLTIIKALALQMVAANALAVFIPTFVIQKLDRKKVDIQFKKRKISDQVKWWLLGTIIVCYIVSAAVVFGVQTNSAYQKADTSFTTTINDVSTDVVNTSDEFMTELVKTVKIELDKDPYLPTYTQAEVEALGARYNALLPEFGIGSIDILKKDERGTFVCSSDLDFVKNLDSFHMCDVVDGQSYRLHKKMTDGKTQIFVQEFGQRSDTQKGKIIYSKYAAMSLGTDYYLAICLNEVQFYNLVDAKVKAITLHRHVGNNGHILILDAKSYQVTDYNTYIGKNPGITVQMLKDKGDQLKRTRGTIYNEDCYYSYTIAETYTIVVILPYNDVMSERDNSFILNTFMQIITFAALFILIYLLIDKVVVKKIEKVNAGLFEIKQGNLDTKIDVMDSQEFIWLSNDINLTVDVLKQYIEDAKKRIDDELAFAKTIQLSALPSTFPAFPDKKQFDIYATMDTAKEVGGDFYDFYVIDNDTLAFLIADVSGKGIPAAMFMMEGKAMIKNLAKLLLSPEEVITQANDGLAQNNEASMFITCWFGTLNYRTGHVKFANAGHNPPLIYRKETERWEYIVEKKNIVLAAMEGMPYQLQEFDMKPGDKLYLYTDGVTEATRNDGVLYGEDRLQRYLNANKNLNLEQTLRGVKGDIDVFIEGADQFDDITMVGLEYKGDKQ